MGNTVEEKYTYNDGYGCGYGSGEGITKDIGVGYGHGSGAGNDGECGDGSGHGCGTCGPSGSGYGDETQINYGFNENFDTTENTSSDQKRKFNISRKRISELLLGGVFLVASLILKNESAAAVSAVYIAVVIVLRGDDK